VFKELEKKKYDEVIIGLNDKGYEIGNVIWVCQKVNNIKTNATPDEIIKVGEFYKKLLEEKDRNIE
jgi:hypothetical protein